MADGGGGRQTSCSYDFKEPSARRAKGRAGDIRFKTSFRNTIYDAFKRRGWKETSSELDWDIHWCERDWMHETFDHVHLEHWQRVNHFRNDRELCRKDLLVKNLKRQRKQLEKEKRTREAGSLARDSRLPVSLARLGTQPPLSEVCLKDLEGRWRSPPCRDAPLALPHPAPFSETLRARKGKGRKPESKIEWTYGLVLRHSR